MSDAVLALDADTGEFDIALENGEIRQSTGLVTAALVSLFADRRAAADDTLPDNTNDRRGWWADTYTDAGPIGSRLWLLRREKMLPGIEGRIEEYAREALQWLIDDGAVRQIDVRAVRQHRDTIGLQVVLYVDALDESINSTPGGHITIDGLDVAILLQLFSRVQNVHFPEFEYEG